MATSASLLLLPEEFTEVGSTLMFTTIKLFYLFCVDSNLHLFNRPFCSMTYMLKSVAYHIWVI